VGVFLLISIRGVQLAIFFPPLAKLHLLHKTVNMTAGIHNFVKFKVIKANCQKHSGCVFASGKNAMFPYNLLWLPLYWDIFCLLP